MQARAQTADMLKGIAVLLMIQVHILELFATDYIYNSTLGKVLLFLGGPPVAPIFMIVFGYFIFSPQKTITQLVWKGIKIFILGMLLNLALNFNLIISVWQKKLQADIWPYVFGVDILQFAGISLITIALLKHIVQKHFSLTLSIIFLSAFLGNFLLCYVPENNTILFLSAYFYGSTDWSYFPLFPWLAYPLAGIALYQLQQSKYVAFFNLSKTKIVVGSVLLLLLVLTYKHGVSVSINLSSYYHHGILFFIWVMAFCLFYGSVIHEVNHWVGETMMMKYIKWLGKNVTILYVIQWIIIGNIATEIYKTVSNPFYLAYWFIAILITASALSFLILKVKQQQPKL